MAAGLEAPWVVELSSQTTRCGFAHASHIDCMQEVATCSLPSHGSLVHSDRTLGSTDRVLDDIAATLERSGHEWQPRLTVVVPARCSQRMLRAISHVVLESGSVDKLLVLPSAACHAVGAGFQSCVVVDAGAGGTDVAGVLGSAVVAKDSTLHADFAGQQLTARVALLLKEITGSPVSDATAAECKHAFACFDGPHRPLEPDFFTLPDGAVLSSSDIGSRVQEEIGGAWTSVHKQVVSGVSSALARVPASDSSDRTTVLLTGGQSRIPNMPLRLAADLASLEDAGHLHIRRSATAERNGFLGAFFLSATSMYEKKLAMSKDLFEEEGDRHVRLFTGSVPEAFL
ncbi:hypothetical protein FNF29_07116 [Cafeteria roenbergensis]|uniref:Uncharacterized protein n=1 Tax=Cafeteria roenbergensis TaxID=33653 RepID=A0A5A8C7B7_CAFRO|nr:hypothetical protein FNF29_07116 [Cafeteria roenbergensis]|eukprot:KAA0147771.1 hypothetical protein FNF29_07116 [Cafeteria roenbergensis]